MTDQHRATPEQDLADPQAWKNVVVECIRGSSAAATILELRARIEALEAAQQDKLDRLIALDAADPTPDPAMAELRAASAEAQPAGRLVERVAEAMQPGTFDWSAYEDEARAAIREVATWLDRFALHGSGEYAQAAKVLRQEVGRG
jgi:hypothetical protein